MTLVVSICAVCGCAVAAPVNLCYACHVSGGQPAPAPRAADAASGILTVRDFAALERLARLQLGPDNPAALALVQKLDRARIVRVDAIGADIATLGSRVVFASRTEVPEARVLTLPAQHAAAGWTLPVTTPRGMALLGRAAGSEFAVTGRDGTREQLRLIAVVQQPEAAALATSSPSRGVGRVGASRLGVVR